ncbi:cryptochrome/photolyase family protein [Wenzhouxiangella sediminis]|uniref:cryptochrome/photolyase family protein n=1 Tax=Wenzhouxiangella sediminis TaxID=1792836 RepID=UPI001C6E0353|nr:cryptochrome/photolyase family protein [Wenzhouxiangella sediminis]
MGIRLGLICGDQLHWPNPVCEALDPRRDRLIMGELANETGYVWHHAKKIVLVLSAMRHFAEAAGEAGWTVDYHRFDAESEVASFSDLVERACRCHEVDEIVVSWPGEWRVLEEIQGWTSRFGVNVTILPDSRFVCGLEEFNRWASDRRQLRMEFFYRRMRKKTGYLMDGDVPAGGDWNFDKSNRKAWKGDPPAASPMSFSPDGITREVIETVSRHIDAFGEIEGFDYPVTIAQARRALAHFIRSAAAHFGDFQDAMHSDSEWLFHSRLSSSLNIGLLTPVEVCDAVEQAWRDGDMPLNAAEGFIRQIIGWREFVRGIYWREMPGYAKRNGLGNDRDLPDFYWSGQTGMNCLRETIRGTRRNAYAHHIQRLMVTGNFALLLGVLPEQICDWYLAVYADAFDWVELPNTLGMVMHADGGLLGSKPYAASGKYIDRMSDYCAGCRYKVKETTGDDACPFNALYWDFLMRHRRHFESNGRMKMMYRHVDRMSDERQRAVAQRAAFVKRRVDEL